MSIEVTGQAEAEQIAALSAWVIQEQERLVLLVQAGCSRECANAAMRECN